MVSCIALHLKFLINFETINLFFKSYKIYLPSRIKLITGVISFINLFFILLANMLFHKHENKFVWVFNKTFLSSHGYLLFAYFPYLTCWLSMKNCDICYHIGYHFSTFGLFHNVSAWRNEYTRDTKLRTWASTKDQVFIPCNFNIGSKWHGENSLVSFLELNFIFRRSLSV